MATEERTVVTGAGTAGRRLHDRFGVVVSIAAGTFGVASVIGLTLLPSSTRAQQALIILACLALAVATYTGVGAWHHAGRFTATALSMAVVVICLAGLSIATESVRADLAAGLSTQDGRGSNPPAGQEPGSSATDSTGGPQSVESAAPPSPPTSPPGGNPPTATEEVFLSGQLRLDSVLNTYLDLDAPAAYSDYDNADELQPDFELHASGLAAVEEAGIATLEAAEPSAARCVGSDWLTAGHVSNLAGDLPLCVLTSDGRVGAITVTELETNSDGTVDYVEFDYVVWKNSDDP